MVRRFLVFLSEWVQKKTNVGGKVKTPIETSSVGNCTLLREGLKFARKVMSDSWSKSSRYHWQTSGVFYCAANRIDAYLGNTKMRMAWSENPCCFEVIMLAFHYITVTNRKGKVTTLCLSELLKSISPNKCWTFLLDDVIEKQMCSVGKSENLNIYRELWPYLVIYCKRCLELYPISCSESYPPYVVICL